MIRKARVTAAYATVKIVDPGSGSWSVRGFYEGGVFPESADPEDVERLVRRGYAEWVDGDAGPAEAPAAPTAVEETVDAIVEETEEADDGLEPQRPGDSASKAVWVDYAVALREEGVSEAEARTAAEAMTKADLITVHG